MNIYFLLTLRPARVLYTIAEPDATSGRTGVPPEFELAASVGSAVPMVALDGHGQQTTATRSSPVAELREPLRYVSARDDTLKTIADDHGVDIRALVASNKYRVDGFGGFIVGQ